jgi:hypothetical protein
MKCDATLKLRRGVGELRGKDLRGSSATQRTYSSYE